MRSGTSFLAAVAALSATALLPTAIRAQDIVTPKHNTNAEASSFSTDGIGTTTTPATLLMVLDELQGTARTIKGVAFRRDGQTSSFNNTAATLLVTVIASTAATTAATVNTTFATNHGANKTTVGAFSLLQWPASSFEGPAPDLWFPVPFGQAYAFNGAGPLAVEIQVTSRTHTSSYFFDWENDSNGNTNPTIIHRAYGTGCIHSSRTQPMAISTSASSNWPNSSVTMTYFGSNLPASSIVTMVIGLSNTSIAGLPLPLVLPGTAMAPSGACTIYNDVVLTIPALADGSGRMTLNLGIPVNPFYNGVDIYGQVAVLDAPANPLGVVLSNGAQHHLVAPYGKPPVGTVYANSASPTGTARPNQGYVVRVML